MKVKKLTIKNIGIIEDIEIPANQPLILFYGEICQGKTTILNAVRWACGGQFPADIIRHGATEAYVALETDSGSIRREWYVGKDGETKAREVTFIRDGKVVKRPVDEIKRFLNPFLLDQDHLRKMGETERGAYFINLFGVDTSSIDKALTLNEGNARELRAKIKGYGDIDLALVERVDVGVLRNELKDIREKHDGETEAIRVRNREKEKQNRSIREAESELGKCNQEIEDTKILLERLMERKAVEEQFLVDHKIKTFLVLPNPPDTSATEKAIDDGIAANVRHEQYLKNLERDKQRKADQHSLSTIELTTKNMREERAKKIMEVNQNCPIKGLEFKEDGTFTYQGTSAGMLSGSHVMKLSSELSALYPEGLGLDLIDRAESLGKSIFTFIERAQKEKKTILATIVGEKPTKVPENVGVFVVENGKIK